MWEAPSSQPAAGLRPPVHEPPRNSRPRPPRSRRRRAPRAPEAPRLGEAEAGVRGRREASAAGQAAGSRLPRRHTHPPPRPGPGGRPGSPSSCGGASHARDLPADLLGEGAALGHGCRGGGGGGLGADRRARASSLPLPRSRPPPVPAPDSGGWGWRPEPGTSPAVMLLRAAQRETAPPPACQSPRERRLREPRGDGGVGARRGQPWPPRGCGPHDLRDRERSQNGPAT